MQKWILIIIFSFFISNAFAKVCHIPEKLMLRPTGLSYQNNKLYVLGQTYGAFYSLDLNNCHATFIAGGQQNGFVLPVSLVYNANQHQWIVFDAATGLINIENGRVNGMLGKNHPKNIVQMNHHVFGINDANIFTLNTQTGDETIISDAYHGSGPVMLSLTSIAGAQGNLFVLDNRQKKIFEINPENGNRTLFVDLTQLKNNNIKIKQPVFIASNNQDLFLTDPEAKQIIAINLKLKQAHVLNSNETQKNNPMIAPFGMFYDHDNHQLYVSDYAANAIDVLPIISGQLHAVRHTIAMMKKDGPYPHMVFSAQLIIHNGNIIAGDQRFPGVFSVNPKTGKTTLLTAPEKGKGPLFTEAVALNQFLSGQILFSDTFFCRFYTINSNGNRKEFIPDIHDKIIPVDPWGLVRGDKKDWYVSDGGSSRIFKLHFNRHHYTVHNKLISSNQKGIGPTYHNVLGITWLPQEKKLVVADNAGLNASNLLLVDPVTGNRATLSGSAHGTGPTIKSPAGIAYDNTDALYVIDSFRPAVFRVALTTGNRTIISGKADDGTWIGTGPLFKILPSLVLAPGNKAYVSDVGLNAIFSVNLKTGDRKIITMVQ